MEVRDIMAETLAHRFTEFLLESNALKFGDFTPEVRPREHRTSSTPAPSTTATRIAALGAFYAEKISQALPLHNTISPQHRHRVRSPAYKGIPLAVSTVVYRRSTAGHNMTVGYTFDRKEKKDHGDGGWMVGTPLTDGMKVLLVDDGDHRRHRRARSHPQTQGRGERRGRGSRALRGPHGEDQGLRHVRRGRPWKPNSASRCSPSPTCARKLRRRRQDEEPATAPRCSATTSSSAPPPTLRNTAPDRLQSESEKRVWPARFFYYVP